MPVDNIWNNPIKPVVNEGISSIAKTSGAGFSDIFEKNRRSMEISEGGKNGAVGNEDDYVKAMLNKSAKAKVHAELEAKTKALVKKLAGFLGISEGFLQLVMDGLNIKPEDLFDDQKRGAILKKLEDYFGMDDDKKKEFEDFVGETLDTINSGVF